MYIIETVLFSLFIFLNFYIKKYFTFLFLFKVLVILLYAFAIFLVLTLEKKVYI